MFPRTAVLAILAAMLASNVSAQTCSITQITPVGSTVNSFQPWVSADGNIIVYLSDFADSPTRAHPEIVLFRRSDGFRSRLTVSPSETFNTGISMTADASTVAFLWNGSLGQNADNNFELFVLDVASGQRTQLTTSVGTGTAFLQATAISDDGRRIAFSAVGVDLVPGENPDLSEEIYLLDRQTGTIRQITHHAPDPARRLGNLDIDSAGRQVVFSSNVEEIPGGNPDRRNEAFLYDVQQNTLQQLTSSLRRSSEPSINAAGTLVAFAASVDPLNPDAAQNVVTISLPGRVVRLSDGNLTGANPSRFRQIFSIDVADGLVRQVTATAMNPAWATSP